MQSVLLILPDFLIILLGALLARKSAFSRSFWSSAEKLVFYVLFPPLLFLSIATSSLRPSAAVQFLTAGIGAMLLAVAAALTLRLVVRDDDVTHASVFQCGFRFNTYIGFAVCGRLFGESGFALLALLIAFWVPISNTIAVSALARAVAKQEAAGDGAEKRPSVLRTVLTNPLIIATIAGLAVSMSGLTLPDTGVRFLRHLGNASLSVGLLCIGAGLQFGEIRAHRRLIAASAADRLLLVPVIALAVCRLFSLPPLETGVAVLFAVLPTAQSCYVMTAAMKGNAPAVAGVTTAQTLAAMATIPFWIAVVLLPLSEMLR